MTTLTSFWLAVETEMPLGREIRAIIYPQEHQL